MRNTPITRFGQSWESVTRTPVTWKTECGPMCHSCDQLGITTQCPLDPNTLNTWQPGSLHDRFVDMTTLPAFQKYDPVVLSRPDLLPTQRYLTRRNRSVTRNRLQNQRPARIFWKSIGFSRKKTKEVERTEEVAGASLKAFSHSHNLAKDSGPSRV